MSVPRHIPLGHTPIRLTLAIKGMCGWEAVCLIVRPWTLTLAMGQAVDVMFCVPVGRFLKPSWFSLIQVMLRRAWSRSSSEWYLRTLLPISTWQKSISLSAPAICVLLF